MSRQINGGTKKPTVEPAIDVFDGNIPVEVRQALLRKPVDTNEESLAKKNGNARVISSKERACSADNNNTAIEGSAVPFYYFTNQSKFNP